MSLKEKFVEVRNNYVINQARNAKLPKFGESRICRQRVIFSGRVQKVGFRLEVCELAKRLGLTGFCKNLENGDVLAELQGEIKKIEYLISFMGSLKRIKIKKKVLKELEVDLKEERFEQK